MIKRLLLKARRRHAEGADLSALLLPPWLDAILNHDRVAYPLHLFCGRLLNSLKASPQVAALEWMKAAAHAQSEEALDCVGVGLRCAIARGEPLQLRAVLDAATVRARPRHSDGRDARMRRRQLAALARVGLPALHTYPQGTSTEVRSASW